MREFRGTADHGPGHVPGASLFSEAYRQLAPAVRGYLGSRGIPDPEAVTHDVFTVSSAT